MVCLLAIGFATHFSAQTFEIVEVNQRSVFAGKLGRRVEEDLVVKGSEGTITVHVSGAYHTKCTHSHQRPQVGQQLSLVNAEGKSEVTISRDSLRLTNPRT